MDERPLEAMQEAIKVIKQADPRFKITLAGNIIKNTRRPVTPEYPVRYKFREDVKAERDRKGQISTVYTCCSGFPEYVYLLRSGRSTVDNRACRCRRTTVACVGAVNSWTAIRCARLPFPYLGCRRHTQYLSGRVARSVFERLVEGLQDAEKIRILREELKGGKLDKLNKTVAMFTPEGLAETQKSATGW